MEPHTIHNAALDVVPGSHRRGFIEHMPFININGLCKLMVPPKTMDELYREFGLVVIEGEPGDALFFHTNLVHGPSHNISPQGRMVVLSQMNTVGNEPPEALSSSLEFNLRRAEFEIHEAERRVDWFKRKFEDQLKADDLLFGPPVPEEEKMHD
ncbi:phytanoyl-CoA dioxygenase family protein [Nitrospiraceae bacterium AH_259_D15_M11_P09]|nr:phytanoyl-CoA dioxygenase family protein [Nitrospiraceae bacterium AH_259_D15_M11_P09]